MSKEQTESDKLFDELNSEAANGILECHAESPIKELTIFANKSVEDYKEKLKAEIEGQHEHWLNEGQPTTFTRQDLKRLIDSIK